MLRCLYYLIIKRLFYNVKLLIIINLACYNNSTCWSFNLAINDFNIVIGNTLSMGSRRVNAIYSHLTTI